MCMTGRRVVNAVGRGANGHGVRGTRGGGRVLGSRRRRGASEAAIDEARTRLAHATAARNLHSLLIQPPLLRLLLYGYYPRTRCL